MMGKNVDLGFLEECTSWKLDNRFFPSKVGGKPAWLDLEHLPDKDILECNVCNKQLIFLGQIYAPYEEDESNFHRTLFLFVCRTTSCTQNKDGEVIKVFRSQLPRINKFYSSEPPEQISNSEFRVGNWLKLCDVCGCPAEKHCSKCKTAYCCKEHQVLSWKEGHKIECGTNSLQSTRLSPLLFPELELVIEPEVLNKKVVDENQQLEEFQKLQEKGETGTMANITESELEPHISIVEDKTFAHFQKCIEGEPEQVVRYQRGGEPLWIAKEPIPNNIPNCEYCQGPRQFEFQIMPQMLVMLKESELDWGVVCIYTCKNSCTDIHCYKKEFVFNQNVSE